MSRPSHSEYLQFRQAVSAERERQAIAQRLEEEKIRKEAERAIERADKLAENANRVIDVSTESPMLIQPVVHQPQPHQAKQLPPIAEQAKNFAKDMKNWASAGMAFATKEVQEKRKSTCAECEFKEGTRCSKCGCFTDLKAMVVNATCPIGKW